jgi:hypothetical protein
MLDQLIAKKILQTYLTHTPSTSLYPFYMLTIFTILACLAIPVTYACSGNTRALPIFAAIIIDINATPVAKRMARFTGYV